MLDGQTAVVTGGSNGIGRCIARTFAEHGADVVVTDRDREPRYADTPTSEVIDALGQEGTFVETDVSNPGDVKDLFGLINEKYGSLDVLVNNAGISAMDGSVSELSAADWRLILDVNLSGTFHCSSAGLPLLRENGGAIVNISSTAGIRATAGGAAYSASKAGITNLTRSLAVDYGNDGVRANSIHPGPVETAGLQRLRESDQATGIDDIVERVPAGRIASPADVASVAVFLASDMAAYVNGHALVIDGGLTARYY
jgi:NAD(P)-dependent dehydrogenase (short-subunit alcohol dehydrogenase family)